MSERKRIYLCLAHMSGNEQKYIQEAFDTNWVVPLGPNVNAFEEELEDFLAPQPPKGGVLGSADAVYYDKLKEHALFHRNNPTEAESIMWTLLRGKNMGAKFRRQHIIGQYIVDFVCLKKMLVIEIDGGYHNDPIQKEEDITRTEYLESYGYRVIRFTNEEVIGDTEKVLDTILRQLSDDQIPPLGGQGACVVLNSGTSAIHLALVSLGVGVGDEVICQSFTFCASANPIAYVGATPVFVDSERDTWNIDPVLMEEAIKDRIQKTGRKPKAIMLVCMYGMPAKMDQILEIADRYEIPVLEDSAEAFGSRYRGRRCGTFGRYGVLSFNGNKMITTSGGGALVCPDQESKQRVMYFATQAREAYPYYQHTEIGFNYRMSNICAGIGRGQMTVAEDHIRHHQHVQSLYEKLIADVPGITMHCQPADLDENGNPLFDSNYWLCTMLLDPQLRIKGQEDSYQSATQQAVGGAGNVLNATDKLHTDCEPNANVEAMRLFLDKAQIEARPLWKPMHKQPVFADAPAYVNGISEELFKQGMCLPSGPCVTDDDVQYIVSKIKEAIER